jgi:hypothetical protein
MRDRREVVGWQTEVERVCELAGEFRASVDQVDQSQPQHLQNYLIEEDI